MPIIYHGGHSYNVTDATYNRWMDWPYRDGPDVRVESASRLPVRPFEAGVYNGDDVPEGIFVDWQTDRARQFCYTVRHAPTTDQVTHRWIAEHYGFQHHLHPYRAADAWARRIRQAGARGGQARDPQARDYRRYSNRRWSTEALRTVDRDRTHRHFGVELEFNLDTWDTSTVQRSIAEQAQAAGLTFVERWGNYGRNMLIAGWQGTYDSTVTGGEIISDILTGDDASVGEVMTMLRIIRDNGGIVGDVIDNSQGTHVHHDARDFTSTPFCPAAAGPAAGAVR
jgi:hypothetical protein